MDEEEEHRKKRPFDISKLGGGRFVGGATTLSVLRTNTKPICRSCLLCSMLFASQPHIVLSVALPVRLCLLARAEHGGIQPYKRLFLYVNQTKKISTALYNFGYLYEREFVFVFMKKKGKKVKTVTQRIC